MQDFVNDQARGLTAPVAAPPPEAPWVRVGIVQASERREVHLFNALVGAETGDYPFTTIDPNVAVVPIPDERLERIAEIGSSKVVLETIEFHDIAGLVRRASAQASATASCRHRGDRRDLPRRASARVASVPHPEERIDPGDDIELIELELLAADLGRLAGGSSR